MLRRAAAAAVVAGLAFGGWRAAPTIQEWAAVVQRELAPSSYTRLIVADNGAATRTAQATPAAEPSIDSLTYGGAENGALVAAADSIEWVPAVARTWVNVRSDASRGGEVVGVIKPASRAMLGTDRAGWRQVRSTEVSGWVDPRLFEADSLRTRGE